MSYSELWRKVSCRRMRTSPYSKVLLAMKPTLTVEGDLRALRQVDLYYTLVLEIRAAAVYSSF